MLFVCLYATVLITIATLASRIRNQTPSWSKWEPIRVLCPEGKGKGRCYDYCQNQAQLTTIKWLDQNCLPRLEYDDAFLIERRREYIPRWAYAATDTNTPRYYLDFRNTTFRKDIISHPEHVVRLLAVTSVGRAAASPGTTALYDATGVPNELKAFTSINGDRQFTAFGMTRQYIKTLPSVLHPEYLRPDLYVLGRGRYGSNLTQAFVWHWTEFPEELILELQDSPVLDIPTSPFFDVTERVWIRQTDKCQAYQSCETCFEQVNCDWCLLPNHTYACRGFCTGPWREESCGVEPLLASLIAIFVSILFA